MCSDCLSRILTFCFPLSRPTADLTRALPHCRIAALPHCRIAALQHCSMTSIPVSKRGTITLPPDMRRKLGLDAAEHPMMLVELRDGGIFLQPAEALPVRDIAEETLRGWIAEDETDSESIWRKAGKA
jgi:bifunctional DNA-binding transcriptional regulator/antitoxin component of YhaV-PrlF toxin-antitoxin module